MWFFLKSVQFRTLFVSALALHRTFLADVAPPLAFHRIFLADVLHFPWYFIGPFLPMSSPPWAGVPHPSQEGVPPHPPGWLLAGLVPPNLLGAPWGIFFLGLSTLVSIF